MSEFSPESLDEILDLLPSSCRPCAYARNVVSLVWAFEGSAGDSLAQIKHIQNMCTGFTGDAEAELKLDGLFEGDVDNCPYYKSKG